MPLRIITAQRTVSVEPREGERLTSAAARAGLALNLRCGGQGNCGGCRAVLESGVFLVDGERVCLRDGARTVRACRTVFLGGEGSVRFPPSSLVESDAQIDEAFELEGLLKERLRGRRAADAERCRYGVAVDLGTTTVAAALVDRKEGRIIGKASMYNQQIRRADDVAARISDAGIPEALKALQRLVVDDTINPLTRLLCERAGLRDRQVGRLFVSGNTVMTHLFFGLSPESIGRLPFEPLMRRYPPGNGADLGLAMDPRGTVLAAPSISGYIGGDLTSDLYVTDLAAADEPVLLLDIGTNGEMVLARGGRLTACAAAAGPAFEGAGWSHGCRAARGAIEHVTVDEDLRPRCAVVGGGAPKGICGTGAVDFMAEGLRRGFIDARGRYDLDRLRRAGRYAAEGTPERPLHAYLLTGETASGTGDALTVSEYDLSQLLKAKAALFSGLHTLLDHAGLRFDELRRVTLAGGFARHLDLANAITIGLLPDLPLDRFVVVGNGSLAGAVLALLDDGVLPACEALIDRPEVVELNREPGFEGRFIDALALPHLDETLFPNQGAPR